MADIVALPLPQTSHFDHASTSPDLEYTPRDCASPFDNNSGPSPCPPFSFPARSPPVSGSASLNSSAAISRKCHMSVNVLSSANVENKAHTRERKSITALPSFSFNPSANDNSLGRSQTPPSSPGFQIPNSPSKGGRHRRSASEYIGGNTVKTPAGVRSVSPDKFSMEHASPDAIHDPNNLAPKRGHRHRRSAAMSSSDVMAAITQAPQIPSSQTEVSTGPVSFEQPRSDTTEHSDIKDHDPPRTPSRVRVGFSDIVEFIPRPLSIISSATESSVSTIRGHSISGSLSSSASTSPPPRQTYANPAHQTDVPIARPKSAGAIMGGVHRPSFMSMLNFSSLRRPKSASVIEKGNMTAESELPNLQSLAAQQESPAWRFATMLPQQHHLYRQIDLDNLPSQPPTTPNSISHHEFEAADVQLNENFDEDPTSAIVIESDAFIVTPPIRGPASQSVTGSVNSPANDTSSTMIDLDAALAPSDSTYIDSRTAKARGFSTARRSMHSANLSGFMSNNNFLHRRSESEPQLARAQFDFLDAPQLESSSAAKGFKIDNVFEEDEEEDVVGSIKQESSAVTETSAHDPSDGQGVGIGIQIVDIDVSPRTKRIPRKPVALDFEKDLGSSRRSRRPSPSLSFLPYTQRDEPIKILDANSPDDGLEVDRSPRSTITPPHSREGAKEPNAADFLPIARPNPPFIAADGSTESSTSTPHASYTSSTFSTPRMESFSPSFADSRRLTPYTFAEPGPEFRQSVDGVPSLVSSRSTMASGVPGIMGNSSFLDFQVPAEPVRRGSAAAAAWRRKRSSVASLSRLIGVSSATKSNLCFEECARCQTSDGVKEVKETKTKRISRLLKFWKSKEDLTS